MSKYTIWGKSNHPEYEMDEDMIKGAQADGYVLLTFQEDEPHMEVVSGVSVYQLAKYLAKESMLSCVLRQASAIADGMRKAEGIKKEYDVRQMTQEGIGELLAKMMKK